MNPMRRPRATTWPTPWWTSLRSCAVVNRRRGRLWWGSYQLITVNITIHKIYNSWKTLQENSIQCNMCLCILFYSENLPEGLPGNQDEQPHPIGHHCQPGGQEVPGHAERCHLPHPLAPMDLPPRPAGHRPCPQGQRDPQWCAYTLTSTTSGCNVFGWPWICDYVKVYFMTPEHSSILVF